MMQPDEPQTQQPGDAQLQAPQESEQQDTSPIVQWEADEYIHYEKSLAWFYGFGAVVAILIALAIFLFQSYTFAVVIVVMTAAVVVLMRRPPHVIQYAISAKGLYVNDTLHNFSEFRSFAVIHDGHVNSILMIPVRRFQPGITIYFPEEKGEEIVDMLGVRLPMEERSLDFIDKLMQYLRF